MGRWGAGEVEGEVGKLLGRWDGVPTNGELSSGCAKKRRWWRGGGGEGERGSGGEILRPGDEGEAKGERSTDLPMAILTSIRWAR